MPTAQMPIRLFCALLALSNPAAASAICTGVSDLMRAQSTSQIHLLSLLPKPAAQSCGFVQNQAGETHPHCQWEFTYRDKQAISLFDDLNSAIATCAGIDAPNTGDQIVNHPDSYDLRQYKVGRKTLWISLKDKAALQKSYIFIRASHN